MSICARAVLQSDGSYLLGLDPSVTNPSTCAYVVESGADSLVGILAAMSLDDASVIATAVGVLWAFAWGLKQIILVVKSDGSSSNETD